MGSRTWDKLALRVGRVTPPPEEQPEGGAGSRPSSPSGPSTGLQY